MQVTEKDSTSLPHKPHRNVRHVEEVQTEDDEYSMYNVQTEVPTG